MAAQQLLTWIGQSTDEMRDLLTNLFKWGLNSSHTKRPVRPGPWRNAHHAPMSCLIRATS